MASDPFFLFTRCAIAVLAVGAALAQIGERVTANALRADVSFLASDALEGRATPSRGLDIAAEYIAEGFRRAGLEPVGDDGYFQTASFEGARNVAGVLRGSDPRLKDTYVVLTAHYDHLGICGKGDICNGANDDASGTASVIEIAAALGGLATRPRRSVLFLALFGEESGLLGSHYYTGHPIVPLAKTIADINLEQLGRTDETGEGEKLGQFNLTGFDFTNLAAILRPYGKRAGVKVAIDKARSDAFFARGDNAAFAEAGVPSTTLSVTYVFGDYHGPGDKWRKLDYENMARVDRAIALAVYGLADGGEEPRWNAHNPRTEAYRRAR
jgi:hypothetical protein